MSAETVIVSLCAASFLGGYFWRSRVEDFPPRDRWKVNVLLLIVASLLLAGCSTTHGKQYHGPAHITTREIVDGKMDRQDYYIQAGESFWVPLGDVRIITWRPEEGGASE